MWATLRKSCFSTRSWQRVSAIDKMAWLLLDPSLFTMAHAALLSDRTRIDVAGLNDKFFSANQYCESLLVGNVERDLVVRPFP